MNMTGKIFIITVLPLAIVASSSCKARVDPLVIPRGLTGFTTLDTTQFHIANIPEGFFGTMDGVPSDAIVGPVSARFIGSPGPSPGPTEFDFVFQIPEPALWETDHGPADSGHNIIAPGNCMDMAGEDICDTSVQRLNEVALQDVGSAGVMETVIVSLSLASATPLRVSYGGDAEQFFDVSIELDPGATQRIGSARLTRTSDRGGTLESILPVAFEIAFSNTDPQGPGAASTVRMDSDLTADGVPFVVAVP